MADDQTEMALAKMHSTVGQAIEIGKRFSLDLPRCSKLPH